MRGKARHPWRHDRVASLPGRCPTVSGMATTMDAHRFDTLTRMLSVRRSRRWIATAMVMALLPAVPRRAAACEPNCTAKACGDDGCGGSCGECPLGSICIEDIGACIADPSGCSSVGAPCSASVLCCDLLSCINDVCTVPQCVGADVPCGNGVPCCGGFECIVGLCQSVPATCALTGASCRAVDCCKTTDTCIVNPGGTYICVASTPVTPYCAHAGQRPTRRNITCCSRLSMENGRCVVNRWDVCARKRGRRAPCASGSQCRGGKYASNGKPVCVPA